jgi:acyl carrier protein
MIQGVNPMSQTVLDGLKDLIANHLDVNANLADLHEDTNLLDGDSFHLDSIAIMGLIALIEERFNFQFGEDELNLEPFQSLKTLADFVSSKIASDSH